MSVVNGRPWQPEEICEIADLIQGSVQEVAGRINRTPRAVLFKAGKMLQESADLPASGDPAASPHPLHRQDPQTLSDPQICYLKEERALSDRGA